MLINYSNWFAGYITGFPQLKGTILDRLAPNFEKPRNKKFGGLPLAWHIFLCPILHQTYFFPNLAQKPLHLAANGVLVEKIDFFAYFWVKNASKSKFGVCLRLATFLLFVIYQLFIFLPKFGSKTIAITCEWSFSGKNPLFFAYFWVKKASKSKIWGLPEACHISFICYISVIHIFTKIWVKNHCHFLPIEM